VGVRQVVFRKFTGRLFQLYISPHPFPVTLVATVLIVSVVCFRQAVLTRNVLQVDLVSLHGLRRLNDNRVHDGNCK
jgi:hypothetical protein